MTPELILWIYIVLLVVGGIMGFLKAKSQASLIASCAFAAVLALINANVIEVKHLRDILLRRLDHRVCNPLVQNKEIHAGRFDDCFDRDYSRSDARQVLTKMKRLSLLITLLALFTAPALATGADSFDVAGLTFPSPQDWTTVKPSSSMRKAQFAVKGDDGPAEVVFFHFGPGQGGGVQANIDRWLGQFAEPKDKINARTEKKSVNGIDIVYVSAAGTYMSGPPFGQKTPMKNHALLGAIVKNDQGDIFIKMTGPKSTTTTATPSFKKMVEGVKK